MDLKLNNKTALVTGATAGIGLAIARSLAAEGAAVAITGRSRAKLDAAKVPYQVHIAVGQPVDVITAFCQDFKADGIVMGTRGLGRAAGLILGSVARDVIAKAPVPVTVVK